MDCVPVSGVLYCPSKRRCGGPAALSCRRDVVEVAPNVDINLDPRQITRILILIAICLVLLNIAGQVSILGFHHDSLFGLVPLFNLDQERSVPTFYSTMLLFSCSALLAVVARAKKRRGQAQALHWFALALIFFFLSADEMLMLHERLIGPLRSALHTSGLLYFAWVIPYGLLLPVILAAFWKFLKGLPTHTRALFIVAGIAYVTGALGFDLLGGYYYDLHGDNVRDITYAALFTIEESLEMAGIILFVHGLTGYIQREMPWLRLGISSQATDR